METAAGDKQISRMLGDPTCTSVLFGGGSGGAAGSGSGSGRKLSSGVAWLIPLVGLPALIGAYLWRLVRSRDVDPDVDEQWLAKIKEVTAAELKLGLEGYDLSPLGLVKAAVVGAGTAVADWSQWPERHAQAVSDSRLLFEALTAAAKWHEVQIGQVRGELEAARARGEALQAAGEAAVGRFKALLRQYAESTKELVEMEVRQAEKRTRLASEQTRLAEARTRGEAIETLRLALGGLRLAHEGRLLSSFGRLRADLSALSHLPPGRTGPVSVAVARLSTWFKGPSYRIIRPAICVQIKRCPEYRHQTVRSVQIDRSAATRNPAARHAYVKSSVSGLSHTPA
eukprot:XP_001702297.1 predicted protein [Chlamydomonas reinhardtii]